jgi:CheY-like chemotaxis protein
MSLEQPSILIVDDTVANLQLLTGILKERDYRVRPVPSGPEALQAAQRVPPDLVLLDINIPANRRSAPGGILHGTHRRHNREFLLELALDQNGRRTPFLNDHNCACLLSATRIP